MAGPMQWFRRHQKYVLVALAVVAMLGFVVADPLIKMFSNNPERINPVAVHTSFIDLRERELSQMVEGRALLNRFLELLAINAAQNLAVSRQVQLPPEQIRMFILQQMGNEGLFSADAVSEQGVVRTLVLAHQAQQMGMSVSNETVFDYLRKASLEQVTPDQLRQIIATMKISQRRIFEELRTVLLANKLQQVVFAINETQGITPGMRWGYFERLKREVNAEVLPLPVSNFVAQVGQPDEAQLKALFEQHKYDYPQPGQPNPGFRIPPKGQFQGFKAVYEKFAEPIQVSEKEIVDYYNAHRDEFPDSRFGGQGPEAEARQAEREAAAEASPADQASPSESGGADESKPPAEPAPSAESTKAPEPAANPQPDQPDSEQPSPQAPSESPANTNTSPDSNKSQQPDAGGGGDDGGSAAQPAATPPASAPEPTNNSPPSSPPPDAPPNPDDQPAAQAESNAQGDSNPQAPAPSAPAASVPPHEPILASDEYELPGDIREGIWRWAEEIRDRLVGEKVNPKIDEIFDKLAGVMDDYAQKLELYEIEKEDEPEKAKEMQPPPAPDFKQLAAENGVEAFETGMVNPFEAELTDVGQSSVDGRQFAEAAFESLPIYSVRRSQDVSGNRYLFWKLKSSKASVPTFDEVKLNVVAAWKTIEARKLAEKRAGEMAAQAQSSGKTLKELFAGDPQYEISETGFFSWMTQQQLATQFGQPRVSLSEVKGVKNAGEDFMRTVFGLEPGQASYALNAPEDTVYVARVIEARPGENELLTEFVKTDFAQYIPVAQLDNRELVLAWLDQLEAQAGLEWERPPRETEFRR